MDAGLPVCPLPQLACAYVRLVPSYVVPGTAGALNSVSCGQMAAEAFSHAWMDNGVQRSAIIEATATVPAPGAKLRFEYAAALYVCAPNEPFTVKWEVKNAASSANLMPPIVVAQPLPPNCFQGMTINAQTGCPAIGEGSAAWGQLFCTNNGINPSCGPGGSRFTYFVPWTQAETAECLPPGMNVVLRMTVAGFPGPPCSTNTNPDLAFGWLDCVCWEPCVYGTQTATRTVSGTFTPTATATFSATISPSATCTDTNTANPNPCQVQTEWCNVFGTCFPFMASCTPTLPPSPTVFPCIVVGGTLGGTRFPESCTATVTTCSDCSKTFTFTVTATLADCGEDPCTGTATPSFSATLTATACLPCPFGLGPVRNPATEVAEFFAPGTEGRQLEVRIYSLDGSLLRRVTGVGPRVAASVGALPRAICVWVLARDGVPLGRGLLAIENRRERRKGAAAPR